MGLAGAGVVALATTVVLQPLLIWFLRRRAMLDVPNGRSSHQTPTPRGGGIGVLIGIWTGVAVSGYANTVVWMVLVAASVLALVGLVDDLRGLAPTLRLAAQVVVGGLAGLGLAVSTGTSPWLALFTTIWVAGFTNAFNFMDGVNGISGLNAGLMGSAFVVAGVVFDAQSVAVLGVVIAGAGLGFLVANASGRIFLGDVGSYCFGAAIALTSLLGVLEGAPVIVMVAPLLIYVADTGVTLVRRIARGEVSFEPHREHVYQRLLGPAWPHAYSALLTAAAGLVVTLGGWLALSNPWAGLSVMGLSLGGYLALPLIIKRTDAAEDLESGEDVELGADDSREQTL